MITISERDDFGWYHVLRDGKSIAKTRALKAAKLIERAFDRAGLILVQSEQEELEKLRRCFAYDTGAKELPKGLFSQWGRLDVMWQQLVRERDEEKDRAYRSDKHLAHWRAWADELISRDGCSDEKARRRISDVIRDAEAKLDRCKAMFDLTRHRILKRLGETDMGKSWSWIEGEITLRGLDQ